MINYYDILGLPWYTSDDNRIKKTYRKIAIKYHPDKVKGAEEFFRRATEAYETLKNPDKREKYNDTLNLNKGTRKGTNLKVSITVKIEDLIKERKKLLVIKRKWLCQKCHGTGSLDKKLKSCSYCYGTTLDILALIMGSTKPCTYCNGRGHVADGIICDQCKGTALAINIIQHEITLSPLSEYFILKGLGNYCFNGKPGDLKVEVFTQEHPLYKVDKLNVTGIIKINPAQAILGDIINLEVFGRSVKLNIPPGIQDKTVLKYEEKGITYEKKTGCFKAIINIIIPSIISNKEKELYQEILKIEKEQDPCQMKTLNF